jgi:hypothetical protein
LFAQKNNHLAHLAAGQVTLFRAHLRPTDAKEPHHIVVVVIGLLPFFPPAEPQHHRRRQTASSLSASSDNCGCKHHNAILALTAGELSIL